VVNRHVVGIGGKRSKVVEATAEHCTSGLKHRDDDGIHR